MNLNEISLLSNDELFLKHKTSIKGLCQEEALNRLKANGYKVFEKKKQ